MGGPEVERLIGLLARLPGLGPRSARRAALRMLQQPEARMLPLAAALTEAARAVRPCRRCGNLDSRDPCGICADPARDQTLVCVVEGVGDLWALERAGVHRGRYHVLGGTLSALSGIGPDDLNTRPLLAEAEQLSEVILALGATVDGASTAHWLTEQLRRVAPELRITRVGQGVPFGGALDVLDDGTLTAALRGRRAI
ncbi:MAG: recombination mediator RecR [Acetobacteraceae bacterium]